MTEPTPEEIAGGIEALHRHDCPGCGVSLGYRHSDSCDVARCSLHGQQYMSCYVCLRDMEMEDFSSAQPTIWKGEWPGIQECRDLDLWVWDFPGIPGKSEDLNTLALMGYDGRVVWDQEKELWVRPS